MNPFDACLQEDLAELERRHLRRQLRQLDSPQGPEGLLDGRRVVHFSSNDYLGLANAPFLREAALAAAEKYGWGSGASRLISGNQPPHQELEAALANFKGTEAALAFSCGFATAVGTVAALAGKDDVLLLDKLCHACLVDGARLSGATLRVFPHNDLNKLEAHLRWAREKHPRARILVLVESVYSMDGDVAPLREIVELKNRHGAWLLVDEAHGVGVIGKHGGGLVQTLNLGSEVEVQMGTLGKALGSAGGYIAGSRSLVDYLIHRARSFVFSTAPPAAQAAASAAAVRWLETTAGEERVAQLTELRRFWGEITGTATPPSAIIPIPVGAEARALTEAARLAEAGFFVPAVRYPTVPKSKARLRLTLTAHHTEKHLRDVADLVRFSSSGGKED